MFLPLGDDVESRTIPVTGTLLVLVNVLVWAYTTRVWIDSAPDHQDWENFMKAWGLVPTDVEHGRVVGFLTHMFLHADIFHLLGNMIVLWAFVNTLENALGRVAFLGFYVIWGLLAAGTQLVFSWGQDIPLVGASGAIAGMIGAYVVAFGAFTKIRTLVFIFAMPKTFEIPASLFVAIWVALQLWSLAGEDPERVGGVAWYAHLGGFAGGALTMLMVRSQTDRRLVRMRHGGLEFVDGQGDAPPSKASPAASPADTDIEVPNVCPYCNTELSSSNQIGDKLLQCPNPECGRLVYMG